MRLIDADALRTVLGITGTADSCKGCTYCDNRVGFACNTYDAPSFATVCEFIDDAPTVDAVPVVRCKDCKHTYLSDNFGITSPWLMCKGYTGNTWKCDPDGYCSRGERKEQ